MNAACVFNFRICLKLKLDSFGRYLEWNLNREFSIEDLTGF